MLDTLAVARFAHGGLDEAVEVQKELVALMNGKDLPGISFADAVAALQRYRKAQQDKTGKP